VKGEFELGNGGDEDEKLCVGWGGMFFTNGFVDCPVGKKKWQSQLMHQSTSWIDGND
jgi:hypothetical protein